MDDLTSPSNIFMWRNFMVFVQTLGLPLHWLQVPVTRSGLRSVFAGLLSTHTLLCEKQCVGLSGKCGRPDLSPSISAEGKRDVSPPFNL